MIHKTYKFRLYPTKAQVVKLESTLTLCCELYNAALQERRDAWALNRISIFYKQQVPQLVEIKKVRTEYNEVYGQVLQDVLRRLEVTFQAFFARVRRREKAGFPRFRSATRYNNFTYPQKGFWVIGNKLKLSKIGGVKLKLHRPIEGRVKTLTVKRECGRWYAYFSVESGHELLPEAKGAIGIDVGLTTFVTLSDGTVTENPRYYQQAQARLRRAQRKVARRKKGSNRRLKAVQLLARIHAHVRDQRADFHHKVSRQLVNSYGLIAVENLNIKGLAAGMFAKPVNDAGWASFIIKLSYKAECAGRKLMKVDPRGTSQRCVCGNEVKKTLAQRWHACESCGLSVQRDHASAMEILRLGLSLQALTCPAAECVA